MGEYADMCIEEGYSDYSRDAIRRRTMCRGYDVKTIESETEQAWQIVIGNEIDFLKFALWFPKSQCRLKGKKLTVPDWLMEKKISEYLEKKTPPTGDGGR